MTDGEINALVAMHIFGTPRGEIFYMAEGREWITTRLPDYSEDMNDAWQVVERFKKPLWAFTLYLSHDTYTADFAEWEDETSLGDKRKGTASSKSASRAICLAALRALGVVQ